MRIIVIDNETGDSITRINISFFGYGSNEFANEIKKDLYENGKNMYIIRDPKDFFNKINGRISKVNTGKLFYYIFTHNCKLQLQVW
jgi:hypothetical protein